MSMCTIYHGNHGKTDSFNTIKYCCGWRGWITQIWSSEPTTCRNHKRSTEGKLGHLFKILGNFLSINNDFETSCTVKSLGITVFTNKTNNKRVTWKEIRPCLIFSSVPLHSTLQREVYDSAKMVLVSALNFGNNLLQETERIWKQFVTVQARFFPP